MGRGIGFFPGQIADRHLIMSEPSGRGPLARPTELLTEQFMRVVVTGGAGFLGSRLARALLARDTLTNARGEAGAVRELLLIDVVPATVSDPRVTVVIGDLTDKALLE